jgi:hypothetical protein
MALDVLVRILVSIRISLLRILSASLFLKQKCRSIRQVHTNVPRSGNANRYVAVVCVRSKLTKSCYWRQGSVRNQDTSSPTQDGRSSSPALVSLPAL